MKIVFASDSFKGTLSSAQICSLLQKVATATFPSVECVPFRMSDGGEGLLEAIGSAKACEPVSLYVHDALMRPLRTQILICGDEAFVEAAATCGLSQLREDERNPLLTTSYGVGECVGHALHHGCNRVYVGLGGTCTNDGGMGFLRALGIRFFDESGCELAGYGADLSRVASIDESGLFPLAREVEFIILGDVTNPLLGQMGATRVFGRQKGADDEALDRLEAGMCAFANVVSSVHPGADFNTPGHGAAGGLGMALSVFLGAQMRSGIEEVMRLVDFDAAISDADLVVTGEGRLDGQSLQGKVVSGVADHARKAGVQVAVVCGASALDEAQLHDLGVAYLAETSAVRGTSFALSHAEEAYLQVAKALFAKVPKEQGCS